MSEQKERKDVDPESLRETITRVYDNLTKYEEEICGLSDRAAAILAAASFDAKLRHAIESMFARRSGEVAELVNSKQKVFKGRGPLHSLSAKIDLGWAMGLYDACERRRLRSVGQIRNRFAHAAEPVRFDDEKIAERCRALVGDASRDESPRSIYVSYLKRLETDIRDVILRV